MKNSILFGLLFTLFSCFNNVIEEQKNMSEILVSTFSVGMSVEQAEQGFEALNLQFHFVPKERVPKQIVEDNVRRNWDSFKGRYVSLYRENTRSVYDINIALDVNSEGRVIEATFQEFRR